MQAELDLQVKEDSDKVLARLLKSEGLISIEPDVFQELTDGLESARAATDSAVATAVGQARGIAEAKLTSELDARDAKHATKSAQLVASNTMLTEQIAFLNKQLDQATTDRQADRDNAVAIANANAGAQGVVVNTTGK